MRRTAAILILVAVAACKPKPPPPAGPTPAERGAAIFAPVADKLGEAIAADLKIKSEAAFKQYLDETKSTTLPELGGKIGKEIVTRFAVALSLTAEQEAQLKAGKFNDTENDRKMNAAIGRFLSSKAPLSDVCRMAMQKVQSGEWKQGLPLEFTVRIVEGQLILGADPHNH